MTTIIQALRQSLKRYEVDVPEDDQAVLDTWLTYQTPSDLYRLATIYSSIQDGADRVDSYGEAIDAILAREDHIFALDTAVTSLKASANRVRAMRETR